MLVGAVESGTRPSVLQRIGVGGVRGTEIGPVSHHVVQVGWGEGHKARTKYHATYGERASDPCARVSPPSSRSRRSSRVLLLLSSRPRRWSRPVVRKGRSCSVPVWLGRPSSPRSAGPAPRRPSRSSRRSPSSRPPSRLSVRPSRSAPVKVVWASSPRRFCSLWWMDTSDYTVWSSAPSSQEKNPE